MSPSLFVVFAAQEPYPPVPFSACPLALDHSTTYWSRKRWRQPVHNVVSRTSATGRRRQHRFVEALCSSGGTARLQRSSGCTVDHDQVMTPTFFATGDVSRHGVRPHTLQRRAAAGQLVRAHRGLYVDPTIGTGTSQTDGRQRWLITLHGHLRRGGPSSVISHRAAALLHGLEGFSGFFDDVTVPRTSGWKSAPAIRSGRLHPDDVVSIEGLRVTSIVRTLLDVGRFVDEETLEFALEHALRGPDRRRPDRWREDLLEQLVTELGATNRPGTAALRAVTRRRGNRRPMGSFAETTLGQGLRRVGIDLTPQPTIEIRTREGRLVQCYYPDFADLRCGLLVEVDGRAGHEGDHNVDRDDRRQTNWSVGSMSCGSTLGAFLPTQSPLRLR